MISFKNLNYRKNPFKNSNFKNKIFRNNKFKKIGVLSIIFIFGSICFINIPATSNASISQSVLSIAKGGTNANNSESAQTNLGMIDNLSVLSTNNNFPSSKAVYNTIENLSQGRFIAVGQNNLFSQCLESANCTDAQNWSTAEPLTDQTQICSTYYGTTCLRDLIYAGGRFIAIGSGGIVTQCFDSADCGIANSWKSAILGNNTGIIWDGITFGQNLFVVVGNSGFMSSCSAELDCSDANSWTTPAKIGSTSANYNDITFGNNQFVAVSVSGSISICKSNCQSTDSWSAASTVPNNASINAITHSNDRFVAGTTNMSITGCLYINDCSIGANWSPLYQISGASGDNLHAIVYGAGRFIAGGAGMKVSQCLETNDCTLGQNWSTFITLPAKSGYWLRSIYAKDTFIFTGFNGAITSCSATADCSQISSWTTTTYVDGQPDRWLGLAYRKGI
ncbi:MAG: hypothetical protein LBT85_00905 [Bifidobacteriaceae bacterium]|jgi:hypothetical protein|nr:hypothetical protein [Bifidobacteriaceae bacterium]